MSEQPNEQQQKAAVRPTVLPQQAEQAFQANFPNLPPGTTMQVKSTQVAMSETIATMVMLDSMKDTALKQQFMQMVRARDEHDKEIERRAQERAEARADRALEASIQNRTTTLWQVFALFAMLAVGFILSVLSGVPAECLYAFGIFFAAGGIAVFVQLIKK